MKNEKLVKLYQKMLLLRRFEERLEELFTTGAVAGTVHTCIGQEAVAIGACSLLKKSDVVTSNHRGHGHFIGKGGDPGKMMAEMFGKVTGYSHGRGGSQLMADYKLGFMGGNGIVGGSIPTATGMALNFKLKKRPDIAVCFFGDGAVNQGTFHESLNMASLWKLPIIYICENNYYAMSTTSSEGSANIDIASKGYGYNILGVTVDGNDIEAVIETVKQFSEKARAGEGPTLIEFQTYRFSGHSRGDKRVYRTRAEESEWETKDPILRTKALLVGKGIITNENNELLIKEAEVEVERAVEFAQTSSYPDPATIMEGVYA